MKITFVGTGEAFDSERCTTSYLIETEGGSLLVDCGYRTPASLMKLLDLKGKSLAETPDVVLFTHEHGDHFAGLTGLLMPIWESANSVVELDKRGANRKLEICVADPIAQRISERVQSRMEEDYKGFYTRFSTEGPSLSFRALKSPDTILGLSVNYAQTIHGAPNYAFKFSNGGKSLAISGDGALSEETRQLFRGVDWLVHEGFYVSQSSRNHASIKDVVEYAIETKIKQVAIVHVNREERRKGDEIEKLIGQAGAEGVEVHMPRDHDYFQV